MILPATPTAVQAIVDDAVIRELFVVGREMERPPYFIAGKGGDMRLAKALRVCSEDRVMPNSDGSFTVEGSEGRTYRVTDSCSCPQSQKGKTKYCYHLIATCIYVEWQRRLRPVAPVDLGTLRAGTLPLPPAQEDDDMLGNGYPVDDETLPLPLPPTSVDECLAAVPAQEARMTEDAAQYIPEPDSAPVAVMEAPVPTPATRPLPGPVEPVRVSIPAEYVMSIKGKRHVLYAGLVIGAQRSGLLTLSADWTYNDAELSLAHAVCTFADGRRYEDSGDASPSNVNKGIAAHFRRVALTRAKARCLRDALGIQECSVEELEGDESKPERETPDMTRPPGEKALRSRIWKIVQARAPEVRSREAVEAYIVQETSYALIPDNYPAILATLEEAGIGGTDDA